MPRKVAYTQITPIPSHIPRQLGIDLLHSHGELIELNPLVLEYHQIKPPRDAPADEFFSTWYEITERIQIIPGTGKLGSGKINFRGVYHDMPWGLQTHVYPPGGIDLRVKYSIKGNQPGEVPEARELGSAAPADGLYLREDIEIKCNFTMVGFVKKGMKEASKIMIDRLIKKAELIDQDLLRQMMDANNPSQQQQSDQANPGASPRPPNSPTFPSNASSNGPFSPNPSNDPTSKRHTLLAGSEVLRKREDAMRQAMYGNSNGYGGTNNNNNYPPPAQSPGIPHPNMMEMMGSVPQQQQGQHQYQQYNQQSHQQNKYSASSSSPGLAIEMMGDTHYHPNSRSPHPSPALRPSSQSHRQSTGTYSELSGEGGPNYNSSSRPNSVVPGGNGTEASSGWGGSQGSSSSPTVGQGGGAPGGYRYNPRDFANELHSNSAR